MCTLKRSAQNADGIITTAAPKNSSCRVGNETVNPNDTIAQSIIKLYIPLNPCFAIKALRPKFIEKFHKATGLKPLCADTPSTDLLLMLIDFSANFQFSAKSHDNKSLGEKFLS